MENERSSVITIGGEQYEMVLTTRATKAISTRYGGLDNLGDKLSAAVRLVSAENRALDSRRRKRNAVALDMLYYAPITEDENGDETYGTPAKLAKAMTADLSVELAEATLYADDGASEIVKEFKSGFPRMSAHKPTCTSP